MANKLGVYEFTGKCLMNYVTLCIKWRCVRIIMGFSISEGTAHFAY